jgi:hypothetical protein
LIDVVQRLLQHFFVNKQEGVGPSIKGVGNLALFGLFIDDVVDDGDDGSGEVI